MVEPTESESGMEDGDEDDQPLEKKYRDQMRQIFPQKIELPISTLRQMLDTQIDLSPGFQRRDVWDVKKQSRFVESIIMNVPVPSVFLGEDQYGKYVVLDGRQRLTALSKFIGNEFELKGLRVWVELNGERFSDLKEKRLDSALTRRFLPAVLILKESSSEVKYDVFDRLNTGGMEAEPMEIRNAIYRGGFSKLLLELSEMVVFRKSWGIPLDDSEAQKSSSTYRRMGDLEIVLRFFALRDREKHREFSGGFRDYLSYYMSTRNADYLTDESLPEIDRGLFLTAITNCWNVFGEDAFRKPSGSDKRSTKSAPFYDAVMVALAEIEPSTIDEDARRELRAALERLYFSDAEFRKSLSQGTNGRRATDYRLKVLAECFADALRIAAP